LAQEAASIPEHNKMAGKPTRKFSEESVPQSLITPAGRECEVWNDEYFSQLRKDAGVPDDFINADWSYDQLEKGGGKGGTLMAFLWGKYIVKEMNAGDHKAMLEITPSYVDHLHEDKSMISLVFLHYKDIQSGRTFFAMRNEVGNGPFHALYDLKGCADDKTIQLNGKAVKDVHKRIWNLSMWCGKCKWSEDRKTYYKGKQDAAHLKLRMTEEQRAVLVKALAYDMEWLAAHRLMDYSLLVARKTEAPATNTFLKVPGDNGSDDILCISIIDFLQKWTCGKRCARGVKVFECNKATVPPRVYAKRFQRHFEECFVASEPAEKIGQTDSGVVAIAPTAGASAAEKQSILDSSFVTASELEKTPATAEAPTTIELSEAGVRAGEEDGATKTSM